jgi:hypothetical protein
MEGGPDDAPSAYVWVQTEASAFDPVNSHKKPHSCGFFILHFEPVCGISIFYIPKQKTPNM